MDTINLMKANPRFEDLPNRLHPVPRSAGRGGAVDRLGRLTPWQQVPSRGRRGPHSSAKTKTKASR